MIDKTQLINLLQNNELYKTACSLIKTDSEKQELNRLITTFVDEITNNEKKIEQKNND